MLQENAPSERRQATKGFPHEKAIRRRTAPDPVRLIGWKRRNTRDKCSPRPFGSNRGFRRCALPLISLPDGGTVHAKLAGKPISLARSSSGALARG